MKYSVDKQIDLCKECIYYHPENGTCNAKKCSGFGSGLVTKHDRNHCTQQKQK